MKWRDEVLWLLVALMPLWIVAAGIFSFWLLGKWLGVN